MTSNPESPVEIKTKAIIHILIQSNSRLSPYYDIDISERPCSTYEILDDLAIEVSSLPPTMFDIEISNKSHNEEKKTYSINAQTLHLPDTTLTSLPRLEAPLLNSPNALHSSKCSARPSEPVASPLFAASDISSLESAVRCSGPERGLGGSSSLSNRSTSLNLIGHSSTQAESMPKGPADDAEHAKYPTAEDSRPRRPRRGTPEVARSGAPSSRQCARGGRGRGEARPVAAPSPAGRPPMPTPAVTPTPPAVTTAPQVAPPPHPRSAGPPKGHRKSRPSSPSPGRLPPPARPARTATPATTAASVEPVRRGPWGRLLACLGAE